ncbi:MAG: acyl-CoA dehydrogenase family protein [Deltaproteobacteria bacterium]|nr:acyl-CoA dehydrogenase family protein [Deltaproteobacteria bacterium]
MQYDLTEEQILLRDMVRKLAKEKVEPGAAARDQRGEFSRERMGGESTNRKRLSLKRG